MKPYKRQHRNTFDLCECVSVCWNKQLNIFAVDNWWNVRSHSPRLRLARSLTLLYIHIRLSCRNLNFICMQILRVAGGAFSRMRSLESSNTHRQSIFYCVYTMPFSIYFVHKMHAQHNVVQTNCSSPELLFEFWAGSSKTCSFHPLVGRQNCRLTVCL